MLWYQVFNLSRSFACTRARSLSLSLPSPSSLLLRLRLSSFLFLLQYFHHHQYEEESSQYTERKRDQCSLAKNFVIATTTTTTNAAAALTAIVRSAHVAAERYTLCFCIWNEYYTESQTQTLTLARIQMHVHKLDSMPDLSTSIHKCIVNANGINRMYRHPDGIKELNVCTNQNNNNINLRSTEEMSTRWHSVNSGSSQQSATMIAMQWTEEYQPNTKKKKQRNVCMRMKIAAYKCDDVFEKKKKYWEIEREEDIRSTHKQMQTESYNTLTIACTHQHTHTRIHICAGSHKSMICLMIGFVVPAYVLHTCNSHIPVRMLTWVCVFGDFVSFQFLFFFFLVFVFIFFYFSSSLRLFIFNIYTLRPLFAASNVTHMLHVA